MAIIDLGNNTYQITHVSGETVKLGSDKATFEPRLELGCFMGETVKLGSDKATFEPRLELGCFMGESKLAFIPQVPTLSESVTSELVGAGNDNLNIIWKPTGIVKDFNERGGMDIIITLLKKPDTAYIDFGYDTTLLVPYHQGELTSEEIAEGAIRPDHVVNSIAWYHSSKGGLVTPSDASKHITTGKAGHTYRMIAYDADGNKTWANWTIETGGIARLNLDKTWLKKATYPVTIAPVGDTFGYTTAGASSQTANANDIYGMIGTPSSSGTVDDIKAYGESTWGTYLKGVLVLDSNYTIVTNGVGDATSISGSAQWFTLGYSTAPSVVGSTTYDACWIKYNDGNSFTMYYDYGTGTNRFLDSSNSYASPTDPTDGAHSTAKYSIYCTYTPSGGAIELSVSDGIKLNDSRFETMTAALSFTDSIKGSDSNSEQGQANVALIDGLKLSDSNILALLASLVLTDNMKLSDSPLGVMTTSLQMTDGIKLSDDGVLSLLAIMAIADGIAVSDSPLAGMLANLQLTDGMKLSDATLSDMVAGLALTEGIQLSDVAEILASMNVVIIDGIKLSDVTVIELLAGVIYLSLTDGLKVSDSPMANMISNLQLSDGTKLSDSPLVNNLANLQLADGIKLSDLTLAHLLAYLQAADGIKLSDTPLAGLLANVQISDGVKLSDVTLGQLWEALIYLSITDGLKVGDTPQVDMLASLSVADLLKMSDTLAGRLKAARLLVQFIHSRELSNNRTFRAWHLKQDKEF